MGQPAVQGVGNSTSGDRGQAAVEQFLESQPTRERFSPADCPQLSPYMPVLKTRSRMIAFRISEEEYQRLCDVCESLGARSVSDLARSAINRLIGRERDAGDPLLQQLELLSRELVQLKTTVGKLSSKLVECEGPKPAEPRE